MKKLVLFAMLSLVTVAAFACPMHDNTEDGDAKVEAPAAV